MTLQISPVPPGPDGILPVTVEGKFSLPEARDLFRQLMSETVRCKCCKILFNGSAITGNPAKIERFFYGDFVADTVAEYSRRGFCRPPIFAYVLKEPVLDPRRLGESVAVSRGVDIRAFESVAVALAWLEGKNA